MPATITVRQGDVDDPIERLTATHFECHDAPANQTDDGAPILYRFEIDAPVGVDDAWSHQFVPDAVDGHHEWDGYVFPEDGSYTVRLRNLSDESDDATLSVTVVTEEEAAA